MKLTNLKFQASYKDYNKSSLEQLNPTEVPNIEEAYIADKIAKNPNNILYKVLLFETYMHNKKLELAHDIIEKLDEQYPNSSFLKINLGISSIYF